MLIQDAIRQSLRTAVINCVLEIPIQSSTLNISLHQIVRCFAITDGAFKSTAQDAYDELYRVGGKGYPRSGHCLQSLLEGLVPREQCPKETPLVVRSTNQVTANSHAIVSLILLIRMYGTPFCVARDIFRSSDRVRLACTNAANSSVLRSARLVRGRLVRSSYSKLSLPPPPRARRWCHLGMFVATFAAKLCWPLGRIANAVRHEHLNYPIVRRNTSRSVMEIEKEEKRWWQLNKYVKRHEYNDSSLLADLRFQEVSSRYKNFTRVSSSDFEAIVNLVGLKVMNCDAHLRNAVVSRRKSRWKPWCSIDDPGEGKGVFPCIASEDLAKMVFVFRVFFVPICFRNVFTFTACFHDLINSHYLPKLELGMKRDAPHSGRIQFPVYTMRNRVANISFSRPYWRSCYASQLHYGVRFASVDGAFKHSAATHCVFAIHLSHHLKHFAGGFASLLAQLGHLVHAIPVVRPVCCSDTVRPVHELIDRRFSTSGASFCAMPSGSRLEILLPSSDLRSTQKTVAPFEFRTGLEIEMKFISNRRNWQFEISIRDQQPSWTNIDESEIYNIEISLVQHFYTGTKIKLDPGSELGSFDLGSGKMLVQPGIRVSDSAKARASIKYPVLAPSMPRRGEGAVERRAPGRKLTTVVELRHLRPAPAPRSSSYHRRKFIRTCASASARAHKALTHSTKDHTAHCSWFLSVPRGDVTCSLYREQATDRAQFTVNRLYQARWCSSKSSESHSGGHEFKSESGNPEFGFPWRLWDRVSQKSHYAEFMRRGETNTKFSPPLPARARCFEVLTQRNIFFEPLAIQWSELQCQIVSPDFVIIGFSGLPIITVVWSQKRIHVKEYLPEHSMSPEELDSIFNAPPKSRYANVSTFTILCAIRDALAAGHTYKQLSDERSFVAHVCVVQCGCNVNHRAISEPEAVQSLLCLVL
ncbi:hypothetical protein PR048_021476 [Dryococelus australis]|uniref:Uncharacterized protein n=1 Tax=Dryococelus australis TaxID=614101 RepID=A0ABQ9GYA7_9NEOP|nr:hypothetical protein PR048_021476 [Dryococelus australis]